MPPYKRPPPSIDVFIAEVPIGNFRVKIIGSIVNITPTTIVVNDGTGQIDLSLNKISSSDMKIKQLGRFIADIIHSEEKIGGHLIVWQQITPTQAKDYQRLVKIERRIPK